MGLADEMHSGKKKLPEQFQCQLVSNKMDTSQSQLTLGFVILNKITLTNLAMRPTEFH